MLSLTKEKKKIQPKQKRENKEMTDNRPPKKIRETEISNFLSSCSPPKTENNKKQQPKKEKRKKNRGWSSQNLRKRRINSMKN